MEETLEEACKVGADKLALDTQMQHINERPAGDYIEVFNSDWNKSYWSFYGFVSRDDYESDLEEILKGIEKLNYRDGDTYTELINYTGELENFYHYLYDRGHYSHADALDKGFWEALEERGDEHFEILRACYGCDYHRTTEDVKNEENYSVCSDWYDALETFQPELYQALDKANALQCFDAASHFYGESSTKLRDGRIVFTY